MNIFLFHVMMNIFLFRLSEGFSLWNTWFLFCYEALNTVYFAHYSHSEFRFVIGEFNEVIIDFYEQDGNRDLTLINLYILLRCTSLEFSI